MFFLVEQKIAKELQQSPVAIMGMEQFKNANHADDGLDFGDDDEEMEPSPKQAKINTTVEKEKLDIKTDTSLDTIIPPISPKKETPFST